MTETQEVVDEIVAAHRQRVFLMKQRQRATLSVLAYLRTSLGWTKDAPLAVRNAIAKRAKTLMGIGEAIYAGKTPKDEDAAYTDFDEVIQVTLKGMEAFGRAEDATTLKMKKLARRLPVWEAFGKDVKGFGEVSLAVIVGSAGNLSNYATDAKLWKRMGVAVMGAGDGVADIRQGGLGSGASNQDWVDHGYNKMRRSSMYVIGDVLIKMTGGAYRDIYLRRKAQEVAKAEAEGLTVLPALAIPKGKAAEHRSEGVIHRRAQRYMEKRLLRHLHAAWRAAESATNLVPSKANACVPAPQRKMEAA